MLGDGPESAPIRRIMMQVQRSVEFAVRQSGSLSKFADPHALDIKDQVSLSELLDDWLTLFRARSLDTDREVADELQNVRLLIDRHHLQLCISLIADNERLFKDRVGFRVELSARLATVQEKFQLNDWGTLPLVRIDIRDNGPGVPEELKDKIFWCGKSYSYIPGTSNPSEFGTGIGLARVRKIIERHHGRIVECGTVGIARGDD